MTVDWVTYSWKKQGSHESLVFNASKTEIMGKEIRNDLEEMLLNFPMIVCLSINTR